MEASNEGCSVNTLWSNAKNEDLASYFRRLAESLTSLSEIAILLEIGTFAVSGFASCSLSIFRMSVACVMNLKKE
jgi:hypothetical protein